MTKINQCFCDVVEPSLISCLDRSDEFALPRIATMTRYFVPLLAAALAFAAIVAAATTADAGHRGARQHGGVAIEVAPQRVAAFRRAYVDRYIGPSGDWIDRERLYYRPYHYWRGPLVYRHAAARHHAHGDRPATSFICRDGKHGRICRERM